MKKIFILTNSLDGVYRFRNELIIKLLNNKYSIYISAPIDFRVDYYRKKGVKVIPIKINWRGTNPLKDIKLFLFYMKIIKLYKPNIILTFTIKPNIYGGFASRISKIPYFSNITGLGTAIEGKGILQVIAILLYKSALKESNTIFFQNEENMRFMIKNGIKGKSHYLLPGSGVNLNYFRYLKYPSQRKIHFLFIGRVMKAKGIENYLESSKYISQKYNNIVFHVIGKMEEDYKEKILAYVSKGFIKYHGKIDDIRKFLKFSHATIQPSYHEGLSNVILESASSGRPVIASNISGCKEAVEDNKTGLLFSLKNQQSLNETIEKFIKIPKNKKIQMGINGRNKMINEFNRENIVKIYYDLITNTIRNNK